MLESLQKHSNRGSNRLSDEIAAGWFQKSPANHLRQTPQASVPPRVMGFEIQTKPKISIVSRFYIAASNYLFELFKINEYMVTKLNTLGLVCELNFDNDRSQIKTSQFLLGEVQKKFKGNAIHYENELVVCMNEFSTSNEFPRVSIDITENEIELSVESNAYVFNGKINGKRIPKAINKLL